MHRFTSKGVEVSFVAKESYVKGGEITGRPAGLGCGEVFGPSTGVHAEAVAVDASGDIFVVVSKCKSVFEYRASGEYVRAFDVEGAPRFGPEEDIGLPVGVAVDGVSGHLLVSSVAPLPGCGECGCG